MSVLESLKEYFKFDKIFNLLDYDADMHRLHAELATLVKDKYDANYRFIFFHYDTDYHLPNQPGFTLRNLQRILKDLGIPNYFCLILSQKNLSDDLEQLRIEETNDRCTIGFIQHVPPDYYLNYLKTTLAINAEQIEKKFICLNNIRRFHRTALFSMLDHRQLINHGLVSFCIKK